MQELLAWPVVAARPQGATVLGCCSAVCLMPMCKCLQFTYEQQIQQIAKAAYRRLSTDQTGPRVLRPAVLKHSFYTSMSHRCKLAPSSEVVAVCGTCVCLMSFDYGQYMRVYGAFILLHYYITFRSLAEAWRSDLPRDLFEVSCSIRDSNFCVG